VPSPFPGVFDYPSRESKMKELFSGSSSQSLPRSPVHIIGGALSVGQDGGSLKRICADHASTSGE